jgi:hypothetical protein
MALLLLLVLVVQCGEENDKLFALDEKPIGEEERVEKKILHNDLCR